MVDFRKFLKTTPSNGGAAEGPALQQEQQRQEVQQDAQNEHALPQTALGTATQSIQQEHLANPGWPPSVEDPTTPSALLVRTSFEASSAPESACVETSTAPAVQAFDSEEQCRTPATADARHAVTPPETDAKDASTPVATASPMRSSEAGTQPISSSPPDCLVSPAAHQVTELRDQCHGLSARNQRLEREAAELRAELEAAQARVHQLKEQNEQLGFLVDDARSAAAAAPAFADSAAAAPSAADLSSNSCASLGRPSQSSESAPGAPPRAAEALDAAGGDIAESQRRARACNEKLLIAACRAGRLDLVKQTLADPTADRNVTTFASLHTPLYLAAARGDFPIVRALLVDRATADPTKAANVNMPIKNGITPLFAAATAGHTEVVALLLTHGADTGVTVKSQAGGTALHNAAFKGHEGVVRALLENGASVSIRNEDSYTALHLACREGQANVAALLIKAKADVNAPGKDGWTPLHKAAQQGHLAVVKLLVKEGADLSRKDAPMLGFKRTAEDWAKKKQHNAVAEELRRCAEEDARKRRGNK